MLLGWKVLYYFPFMVHKKLCEVPRDHLSFFLLLVVELAVVSQEGEERMRVRTVDLNFFKDREL